MDDPTIAARQEGYSWDDIDAHIGQASQQATEAGYDQGEIDQYLGGSNPAPFEERLQTGWAHQLSADPKLDVSDLTSNPTHRSDYAHGLKEGYVRGPQDFADRYAAAMVGASGTSEPTSMQGAADAASDLAAGLPAKRDFTDAAVALGGDDVKQTRDNVIDHWRDTGTPPIDTAMQAQQDPALHAALTKTPEPSLLDKVKAGLVPLNPYINVFDLLTNEKRWNDLTDKILPSRETMDSAVSAIPARELLQQQLEELSVKPDAPLYDRMNQLAHVIINGLGTGEMPRPMAIEKFRELAGKLPEPKFEVVSPGAEKPITELPAREAVAPVEPAAMEFAPNGKVAEPIEAYHASPYDFDKFDSSKINTGEGSQDEGHGLYFAENPDTHAAYLKQFHDVAVDRANLDIEALSPETQLSLHHTPIVEQDAYLSRRLKDLRDLAHEDSLKPEYYGELAALDRAATKEAPAQSYKVNLHLDPEQILNRQLPINEQTQPVQKAIAKVHAEAIKALEKDLPPEGSPGYEAALQQHKLDEALVKEGEGRAGKWLDDTRELLGDKETSDLLRKEGVQAFKYLDSGSAGKPKGEFTYNYVVLHDNAVKLTEKNGKPVIDPAAPTAAKMQTIGKLRQDGAIEGVPAEQPNFFQNLYEKAVEDGHMAADPDVEQLAIGHDAANSFRSAIGDMFTGMMKDEAGAVPLPALRTPQQTADAAAKAANRDYLRDIAVQTAGNRNQAIANFAGKFDKLRLALDPHQDEWEKQIGLGPAGDPRNTVIGKWLSYIEGRSQGVALDPNNPLTPWAGAVRDAMQGIDKRLRQQAAEGLIHYDGYVQDYFAHMFKDPSAAVDSLGAGSGKLGSRGNLMERAGPPSIVDALEKGLELKATDPFQNLMKDIHNKLSYSYAADMFDRMNTDGMTRWGTARLPGDVKVGTSFGRKQLPADAIGKIDPATGKIVESGAPHEVELYAHPELVKNLNYWLGQVHYSDTVENTLDKLNYMKNTLTGIKLVGPMFHAITTGVGSITGSIGRGLEEVARGQMFGAVKSIIGAPIAPFTDARLARKLYADYANMTGDRTLQRIVDQNFNFQGQHLIENVLGRTPGVYDSVLAGRGFGEWAANPSQWLGLLPRQLRQDFANIFGDAKTEAAGYRALRVPDRVLQAGVTETQRVMSLISDPLFKGAIPAMKLGSVYKRLDSFLRASQTAPEEFIAKRSRQMVQDVDNRLGELQLDNLFWPKMAKQLANISMISTSWTYGTYRNVLSALGYNLERGFEFNPTALTSLIGTGVTLAGAGALMNFIHTGQAPDWRDLANPQTGGKGSGLARGVPERTSVPSEWKEMFDLGTIIAKSWQNPWRAASATADYALGKLNPMWQVAKGFITGKDPIGHDIFAQPGGVLRYLKEQFEPIVFNQLAQRKKESGLNTLESVIGFREAPKWTENWDAWQKWQKSQEQKTTKAEIQRARRENADLETPQDLSDLPAVPGAARPSAGGGIRNSATPREARALGGAAGGGGIRNGADFGSASRSVAGGDVSPGFADPIVRRGGERAALTNEQLFNRLRRRGGGRRGRR